MANLNLDDHHCEDSHRCGRPSINCCQRRNCWKVDKLVMSDWRLSCSWFHCRVMLTSLQAVRMRFWQRICWWKSLHDGAAHVIRRSEGGWRWKHPPVFSVCLVKSGQLNFKICNCRLWLHHFDSESKVHQCMAWKHVTSPPRNFALWPSGILKKLYWLTWTWQPQH